MVEYYTLRFITINLDQYEFLILSLTALTGTVVRILSLL